MFYQRQLPRSMVFRTQKPRPLRRPGERPCLLFALTGDIAVPQTLSTIFTLPSVRPGSEAEHGKRTSQARSERGRGGRAGEVEFALNLLPCPASPAPAPARTGLRFLLSATTDTPQTNDLNAQWSAEWSHAPQDLVSCAIEMSGNADVPPLPQRLLETVRHFGDLGFTSFGGPGVHVVLLKRRFVDRLEWIEPATFADLFALANALPGPGSTQLCFSIAVARGGLLCGVLAFFLWS